VVKKLSGDVGLTGVRGMAPRYREPFGQKRGGAQERTRTFTAVKPLAPEASASTNSTTWALAG
jgi:hypothetical protein